jgi:hypothetical protein
MLDTDSSEVWARGETAHSNASKSAESASTSADAETGAASQQRFAR